MASVSCKCIVEYVTGSNAVRILTSGRAPRKRLQLALRVARAPLYFATRAIRVRARASMFHTASASIAFRGIEANNTLHFTSQNREKIKR